MRRGKMTKKDYEVGSDNVFVDLDLDNASELKTKTLLSIEIIRTVRKRHLKQAEVADILGIPQSKVSNLLQGKTRSFSTDRLMQFLTSLDQDVNISVKPKPKNRKQAHIFVSIPNTPVQIAAKAR